MKQKEDKDQIERKEKTRKDKHTELKEFIKETKYQGREFLLYFRYFSML